MSARKAALTISSLVALALLAAPASAQQAPPTYGTGITIEHAKKVAAAAISESKKNNWKVAIAIVDIHGFPVYFERQDDVQTASINIALEKAKTAAMFRRPSRFFEEAVAKGRVAVIALPGVTPITGGVPIEVGGKIIGGIGVSGMTGDQDEEVASAGAKVM